MTEKEERFFEKVKEICKKPGKPYQFDCPNCGEYAMGFRTSSGEAFIASCNTCHIAGKKDGESAE